VSNQSLNDKQAQFDEYFSITHSINANMRVLEADEAVPDIENIEDAMPYAFRIASEMAAIEAQAIRPLRNLSDHAESLADYLNHQSRKIDLMMSFVLHQQDEPEYRFKTVRFGGGGVIIDAPSALETGTNAELKLFLDAEAAAIFCFGEVISCKQVEDRYHIAFIFNTIREQDQELLVRASLHIQTLQLRKRAQEKKAGS